MKILDLIQMITLLEDIERYDVSTFMHCVRVNSLSMQMAESIGLSAAEKQDLFVASLLHDYGKIFIPKNLLFMKARMSKNEYEIAKLHVNLGVDYLHRYDFITSNSLNGILQHHERLDGTGYPKGIKDVTILGKIIGVADVFDALTTDRCYKGPCSVKYSCEVIRKDEGVKFDKKVIDSLESIITSNNIICDSMLTAVREKHN